MIPHAFVWWIADSVRLSRAARSLIPDEVSDIVVKRGSRLGDRRPGAGATSCQAHAALAHGVSGRITADSQGFTGLERSMSRTPNAPRSRVPAVSVDPVFDGFGIMRPW